MATDDLGDAFKAIGDMNRNHPNHLGTPKERVRALTLGFRSDKDFDREIDEAVNRGTQAVKQI
jgi:hypothetical protein